MSILKKATWFIDDYVQRACYKGKLRIRLATREMMFAASCVVLVISNRI